jgi:L-phenylalanine/L-methionine N-acetyltransferase
MTITVRRVALKDAAAIAQFMAQPAVFGGLLQLPYPSEEAWAKRLTDMAALGSADLMLVAELDGAVVASAGLHGFGTHVRRRHAMGLGVSVALAAQGKGVGSALMAALCDYADAWVGLQRIELTVYTDNAVAVRLYQRFGFVIEGTLKGFALRDGRYVDAYAMARLHPAPPVIG